MYFISYHTLPDQTHYNSTVVGPQTETSIPPRFDEPNKTPIIQWYPQRI